MKKYFKARKLDINVVIKIKKNESAYYLCFSVSCFTALLMQ